MKRYPGIRPFTAEDTHLFKGRDEEKRDLFQLIVLNDIVVLFGKSGIGKSSLLNAGVCPQLEDRNLHPVFIRLNNTSVSPEEQVYELLQEKKYIPSDLPKGLTLWEYFQQFWYVDLGEVFTPVIVLDQFEELFTLYTPEQRQNFIDELADIVNGRVPQNIRQKIKSPLSNLDTTIDWETPPKVKFVLSIRSDYLYLLDELSTDIPAILRTRFQLQMLKKNNAIEAITLPAVMVGNFDSPKFNYSNNALTEIIEELGKKETDQLRSGLPESEPEIEAFQLQMFCQHVEDKIIQQKQPENFTIAPDFYDGKVGIKTIVKEFYNGVISRVPKEYQDIIENLMAKNLIRNKRRIIMEESAIISDSKIPKALLDQLHEERMLRKEARTGSFYYEISHDTLVEPVLEKYKLIEERLEKERLTAEKIAKEKELELARQEAIEEKKRAEAQVLLRQEAEKSERRARQRTRLAMAISILALLLAGATFLFWKNANIATESAIAAKDLSEQKTKEAIIARDSTKNALAFADANRIAANKSAEDAIKQTTFAEKAKKATEVALKTARAKTKLAEEKERIAEDAKADALNQKRLAQQALLDAQAAARVSQNVGLALRIARVDPTLGLRIIDYSLEKHPNNKSAIAGFHEIISNPESNFYQVDLQKHTEPVKAVDFSPNGKMVLTAGVDRTIKLWDTKGNLLRDINYDAVIVDADFSPDGQVIMVGEFYGGVSIIDLEGKTILKLDGHKKIVKSVAFSPDQTKILTGSSDSTAILWDINGKKLHTYSNFLGQVFSVAFSPVDETVLICGDKNVAKQFDFKGKEINVFKEEFHTVRSGEFSHYGNFIVTGSGGSTAKLWSLSEEREAIHLIGHEESISSVSISLNGQNIITGSHDRTIKSWDELGNLLKTYQGHSQDIESVAISPDGQSLLSGSRDNSGKIWSLNGNEVFSGFDNGYFFGIISPDQKMIITQGYSGDFNLSTTRGEPIKENVKAHDHQVTALAFSPDNQLILSGGKDGLVKLWDLEGNEIQTFEGHTNEISSVAFSPDGKKVLTGSYDKMIKLWDVNGSLITSINAHGFYVKSVVFSPDGQTILSAGMDDLAKIWDLNGNLITTFSGHTGDVNVAIFTNDGKRVLTGGKDRVIRIWDLNGKELVSLKGHSESIRDIAVSKNDDKIITSSKDSKVKLWDFSGNEIQTFNNCEYGPDNIAFSLDEQSIYTFGIGSFGKQILMPKPFLEQKIYKFPLQKLYDVGVQLEPEDFDKVEQKEIK